MASAFVDNAKVMAKGQITIPKDVRDVLGISCGDRVTFVVENGVVRIVNSALFAMQMLQTQMKDEKATDDEILSLVKDIRSGEHEDPHRH